jgi:hypothetical protein
VNVFSTGKERIYSTKAEMDFDDHRVDKKESVRSTPPNSEKIMVIPDTQCSHLPDILDFSHVGMSLARLA